MEETTTTTTTTNTPEEVSTVKVTLAEALKMCTKLEDHLKSTALYEDNDRDVHIKLTSATTKERYEQQLNDTTEQTKWNVSAENIAAIYQYLTILKVSTIRANNSSNVSELMAQQKIYKKMINTYNSFYKFMLMCNSDMPTLTYEELMAQLNETVGVVSVSKPTIDKSLMNTVKANIRELNMACTTIDNEIAKFNHSTTIDVNPVIVNYVQRL